MAAAPLPLRILPVSVQLWIFYGPRVRYPYCLIPIWLFMNGQSAVFTVGFQFPFGDIEGVDENFETNTVTFRSTIKRAILGLQLGLTPQISKDGIISLLIVPTITRIKDEVEVELPTRGDGPSPFPILLSIFRSWRRRSESEKGNPSCLAGLINQIKKLES
jgi:hypothetical protein